MKDGSVTFRSLLLGTALTGLFAFLTVYFENQPYPIYLSSTQIAVLPYILLFAAVLLINPICRLLRVVKVFTTTEVLLVFIMCSVSAGISTFGLASQIVPIAGNLFNPDFNTDQSGWDVHVEPYVNEKYFVSEPGSQEAARRLCDADAPWREAQSVERAADSLEQCRDELAVVRRKLEEAKLIPDSAQLARTVKALRRRHAMAQNSLRKAEKWWAKYAGRYDPKDVLRTHPPLIKALAAERERRKAELDAIKAAAFEKITVFRRGLPEEMRAIPGFIYVPGEGLESYADRAARLAHGTSALGDLRKADGLLAEAIRSGRNVDSELAVHVRSAVEKLAPVSEIADLTERKESLRKEIDAVRAHRFEKQRELKELHTRRRHVQADEYENLEAKIGAAESLLARLDKDVKELEEERDEFVASRLSAAHRVRDTKLGLADLLAEIQGGAHAPYPRLQERLWDHMDRFRSLDASMERFVIGDVPWSQWLRPLGLWALIIGLTYLVFMTLNVLIFRQWAHNERLIYPLARLPELLAGTDGAGDGLIPPIFRSGAFWTGFAFAGVIMGWNMICQMGLISGVSAITLDIWWGPYVQNSAFAPLGGTKFGIFFTMIGLAFLIPARISFSLWFFWIFFMVQVLLLCWLGYGPHGGLFQRDWYTAMDLLMAQAGGALMVFAAVVLYKCRRYILCFLMPGIVRDLEAAERAELRISSFLFIFGSIGLVWALSAGLGANVYYTIACYCVFVAIAIGLTRAVTEGGILGFQIFISPFHFIRTIFGLNRSWTSPELFAPLFIYNAIMFQDMKTFIVPAMANGLKIGSDMKMKRLRFHVSIFLCIVVAALVAVGAHLVLAYDTGADRMNRWFHSDAPLQTFSSVGSIVQTKPYDTTAECWWLLFGAVLMAALLFSRRHCFWLPHPIGLIMLANTLMGVYWFSIFLGWAAKSLVAKYGGRGTYEKMRGAFIGLIVGEIFIVVLAMILAYSLGLYSNITLNRM
ncbi:MAG: OPT/YSL family transporter [Planctomycetota bacterium]